jgi:two-component system nitrogen regulation sensor histidine kinase NtrY
MTNQLAGQRNELIEANKQLDERRMFTEAVLSGVSAGVIGLDRDGKVYLPNRSAIDLLGVDSESLINRDFAEAVPEMADLVAEARRKRHRTIQGQVNILRRGKPRNLLVRVTVERAGSEAEGIVVTFDDVTELMTAQRTAAWADVARRIAHEIKNPLTPIQLSAERLKRKYLREVESDPTVFTQCTDTIIRQVADIGRMVDEFSSFARMPAPIFQVEDLTDIVRQELFQQELTNTGIQYTFSQPSQPVRIRCDGRQVAQALSNLLRNAADAIAGSAPTDGQGDNTREGRIGITLAADENDVWLEVADNGPGLPDGLRDRLTEPYVTTKEKGTGLGLAIVKKIMEEHGGFLEMHEAEQGGTVMRLVFPATPLEEDQAVANDQQTEAGRKPKTMVS